MKREKMLRALTDIDDEFIAEACPNKRKIKKNNIKRIVALAACIGVLLTAVGLWMFIPFSRELPDVSEYKGSEYYPLIEKLNPVTYTPPYYKNNFEKITSSFVKDDADGGDYEYLIGDSATGTNGAYRETTDNQVAGVIEGDILKATENHMFYLKEGLLASYAISPEATEPVGKLWLDLKGNTENEYYSIASAQEMHITADGKTAILISGFGRYMYKTERTVVTYVDISNPANMKIISHLRITGESVTTRLVNGKLMLITLFSVKGNPDFSDESQFVPRYDDGSGFKSVRLDDIYIPTELNSSVYGMLWMLGEGGALIDVSAYLGFYNTCYVSESNVFLTVRSNEKTVLGDVSTSEVTTDIVAVGYSDSGFTLKGETEIKGYLKDQYSLDEHNGILRVAATTQVSRYRVGKVGNIEEVVGMGVSVNASLYCIDLSTMKTVAAVESFAPAGERIRSVRFDKDMGYICTAVQNTDPVYFFDLSDIGSITYTDTGTIPGFSTSLIQLHGGYLLGIGQGGSSTKLKIEVYREDGGSVTSVASKEYKGVRWSEVYKSYFVDRERGLIGLGLTINNYNGVYAEGTNERYILLRFDGNEIKEVFDIQLQGDNDLKRAALVDGYLYMFGENGMKVKNVQ